ncbi:MULTISPECIES: hypothetical protein [unclassified Streptococcus]|uniref:hypothetical protein n=1 Tax=unclassified Streptococcus TaxID=2608887 RepID=UPI00359D9500
MAQTIDTSPSHQPIQEVNLDTVKAKIRARETFYLFIGRDDNVDAQLAMAQLHEAETASAPILYLNVKGVNARSYKAFSKKYAIRSHAYIAKFSNRKQIAVYHNDWRADITQLLEFLTANLN